MHVHIEATTPDQIRALKVRLGIAITSAANPSLNATYPLATLAQIGTVARDAACGLGLPKGLATFGCADITGAVHQFNQTEIINLYKAMRDHMVDLDAQHAVLKAGGTAAWPSNTVSIP